LGRSPCRWSPICWGRNYRACALLAWRFGAEIVVLRITTAPEICESVYDVAGQSGGGVGQA